MKKEQLIINTESIKELTLGEIINTNVNAANIFYSYRIPFYVNPEQTLADAIQKINSSIEKFIPQLLQEMNHPDDECHIENKDLRELTVYIERKHHTFVKDALNKFEQYKIQLETQLKESDWAKLIDRLIKDMTMHMQKEDKMLFPLIRYLFDCERFNERPKSRNYGTIKNPIRQILLEHDSATAIVNKIKIVVNECCYQQLDKNLINQFGFLINDFEADLFLHIHLENNVLLPKSIDLENKLAKL